MSKLKRLIEAANRKCEMAWKVYSYNPEKDNELVDTSKAFDCIAAAQAHKREILDKNPNYTVEIIAESVQYKFKVGDRVLYEGDKATVVALRTTSTSPYYDVEKDKEKGKMQHPAYERELKPLQESAQKNEDTYLMEIFEPYGNKERKRFSFSYSDLQKALKDKKALKANGDIIKLYRIDGRKKVLIEETANIDVKNPGVLEVPDGKKVDELPQSHFEKLVDKKGYAEVIRALTNLEVWNKDKNKSLSQWASNMADKLKKKFRPESAQKNEDNSRWRELSRSTKDNMQLVLHFGDYYATVNFSPFRNKQEVTIGKDFNVLAKKSGFSTIEQAKDWAEKALKRAIKGQKIESAQKNEGKKVRDINEVPEDTAVATAWDNGDGTYKIVVFANKKGKLSDNDTNKFLDKKLFKSHKAAVNYALSKGYYVQSFESAQMNETRGYTVTAELSVPDNMNNRDIEDEVERLLRASNKINVVMDVTAERK